LNQKLAPGLFLITLGVIFLLYNLGFIDNFRDWWPLILIAVGISMLFNNKSTD
jgi:hypothetical protein